MHQALASAHQHAPPPRRRRLTWRSNSFLGPRLLTAGEPNSRPDADSPRLTARQLEVLELVAKGLTNKEIGGVLSISPGTVKVHVAAVIAALDVTNRTEAAIRLHSLGLGASDANGEPATPSSETPSPESPTDDRNEPNGRDADTQDPTDRRSGDRRQAGNGPSHSGSDPNHTFRVPGFGDRPAIAVLPFSNLSVDPEHAFLADGIVEDLIAGLGAWRWFPVISRSSTVALVSSLGDETLSPQKASADLGARYLIEGSVRTAGQRVRISARIIDGRTGHQVWSRAFERELASVFEAQDEIVESIVSNLEPALLKIRGLRTLSKHADSLTAWESFERGFTHAWENHGQGLEDAVRFFERAIEIDPTFASAYGGLSYCLFHQYVLGRVANPQETLIRAEALADRTMRLDDSNAFSHIAVGLAELLKENPEDAAQCFDRAIELNPSISWTHLCRTVAHVVLGHPETARASVETAIRLSPEDPLQYLNLLLLGVTYTTQANFGDAEPYFERSIALSPRSPHAYILLAGCRLAAGDLTGGKALAEKTHAVDPDYDPRWSVRILVPLSWKEPSMTMLDTLGVK